MSSQADRDYRILVTSMFWSGVGILSFFGFSLEYSLITLTSPHVMSTHYAHWEYSTKLRPEMDIPAASVLERVLCGIPFIQNSSTTTVRLYCLTQNMENAGMLKRKILERNWNSISERKVENISGRGRPSLCQQTVQTASAYFYKHLQGSLSSAVNVLRIYYFTIQKSTENVISYRSVQNQNISKTKVTSPHSTSSLLQLCVKYWSFTAALRSIVFRMIVSLMFIQWTTRKTPVFAAPKTRKNPTTWGT